LGEGVGVRGTAGAGPERRRAGADADADAAGLDGSRGAAGPGQRVGGRV